jgi:very-short-patch-repair endonuclease
MRLFRQGTKTLVKGAFLRTSVLRNFTTAVVTQPTQPSLKPEASFQTGGSFDSKKHQRKRVLEDLRNSVELIDNGEISKGIARLSNLAYFIRNMRFLFDREQLDVEELVTLFTEAFEKIVTSHQFELSMYGPVIDCVKKLQSMSKLFDPLMELMVELAKINIDKILTLVSHGTDIRFSYYLLYFLSELYQPTDKGHKDLRQIIVSHLCSSDYNKQPWRDDQKLEMYRAVIKTRFLGKIPEEDEFIFPQLKLILGKTQNQMNLLKLCACAGVARYNDPSFVSELESAWSVMEADIHKRINSKLISSEEFAKIATYLMEVEKLSPMIALSLYKKLEGTLHINPAAFTSVLTNVAIEESSLLIALINKEAANLANIPKTNKELMDPNLQSLLNTLFRIFTTRMICNNFMVRDKVSILYVQSISLAQPHPSQLTGLKLFLNSSVNNRQGDLSENIIIADRIDAICKLPDLKISGIQIINLYGLTNTCEIIRTHPVNITLLNLLDKNFDKVELAVKSAQHILSNLIFGLHNHFFTLRVTQNLPSNQIPPALHRMTLLVIRSFKHLSADLANLKVSTIHKYFMFVEFLLTFDYFTDPDIKERVEKIRATLVKMLERTAIQSASVVFAKTWKDRYANSTEIVRNYLTRNGIKFEEEKRIGPYDVDFFFTDFNIILEVNGAFHYTRKNPTMVCKSAMKVAYLQKKGYKVLILMTANKVKAETIDNKLESMLKPLNIINNPA